MTEDRTLLDHPTLDKTGKTRKRKTKIELKKRINKDLDHPPPK